MPRIIFDPGFNTVNLHSVTLAESKQNPEYWRLMQNMYREQSARIIQRRFRKKIGSTFLGKYSETLNGPLSLKFIKEPDDKEYLLHAEKIKKGQYIDLDFNEPQFVRNIYKALRLKEINVEQLALAMMLYDAQEQFEDKITYTCPMMKKYSYDEKGPYKYKSLDFVTAKQYKSFEEKLRQLPEEERCYYSIHFTKSSLLTFLFISLHFDDTRGGLKYLYINHYSDTLKKYIKQNASPDKMQELIQLTNDLFNKDKNITGQAVDKMKTFLKSEIIRFHFPVNTLLNKKDSGLKFIVMLITSAQLDCNLYLCPQVEKNDNDPENNFLCLNLPTISSFNLFQECIYGKEHVSVPYFTAGQIGTRFIRELDEHPEKYGIKQQARPVEMCHPDLISNPKPHGLISSNFMITWHDFAVHSTRNSSQKAKPVVRYLRTMLEKEKGFDMSKAIWNLSDMDTNAGIVDRQHCHLISPFSLGDVLRKIEPDFFIGAKKSDVELLIINDFITHRKTWNVHLKKHPKNFFNPEAIGNQQWSKNFKEKFLNLKKTFDAVKKENISSLSIFNILIYRLKKHKDAIALCKSIDNKIGLKNLFYWDRNNGLKFNPEYFVLNSLSTNFIVNCKYKTLADYKDDLYVILSRINECFDSKNMLSTKPLSLPSQGKDLKDSYLESSLSWNHSDQKQSIADNYQWKIDSLLRLEKHHELELLYKLADKHQLPQKKHIQSSLENSIITDLKYLPKMEFNINFYAKYYRETCYKFKLFRSNESKQLFVNELLKDPIWKPESYHLQLKTLCKFRILFKEDRYYQLLKEKVYSQFQASQGVGLFAVKNANSLSTTEKDSKELTRPLLTSARLL